MFPELFRIPFLEIPIHTYGVMIVTGFMLGLYIAQLQARKYGQYETDVTDFGFWALLGGVAGARLLYVIVDWRVYFVERPFVEIEKLGIKIPSILAVWQGGLVFWGGAIGGCLAFLIFAHKRKLPRLMVADWMFLGLPLAQAFGRIGCVMAGCCWGKTYYHVDHAGKVIADLPLSMRFPPESLAYDSLIRSSTFEETELMRELGSTLPLFPSQLFEAAGAFAIFLVLCYYSTRKKFHGQIFLMYAILYSVMRSFLEIYRGDAARGFVIDGVLSTSQFISIFVVLGSIAIIWKAKGGSLEIAKEKPLKNS